MVHWQNVEFILQNGICSKTHPNKDPNYINIGMRSLIQDRHEYSIPLENKGTLGEYVPFYFAGHSPMLYLIMNGYSGVERKPQDDIVFIVCNYDDIKNSELQYVFTDRNAKIAIANFYQDEEDLNQLDWDSIKGRNWRNDEANLARRDLKQAEFLIRHHIPIECIHCFVVKTISKKEYLDQMIRKFGLGILVYVDNNCKLYY